MFDLQTHWRLPKRMRRSCEKVHWLEFNSLIFIYFFSYAWCWCWCWRWCWCWCSCYCCCRIAAAAVVSASASSVTCGLCWILYKSNRAYRNVLFLSPQNIYGARSEKMWQTNSKSSNDDDQSFEMLLFSSWAVYQSVDFGQPETLFWISWRMGQFFSSKNMFFECVVWNLKRFFLNVLPLYIIQTYDSVQTVLMDFFFDLKKGNDFYWRSAGLNGNSTILLNHFPNARRILSINSRSNDPKLLPKFFLEIHHFTQEIAF